MFCHGVVAPLHMVQMSIWDLPTTRANSMVLTASQSTMIIQHEYIFSKFIYNIFYFPLIEKSNSGWGFTFSFNPFFILAKSGIRRNDPCQKKSKQRPQICAALR
jgi:hypothetical protein